MKSARIYLLLAIVALFALAGCAAPIAPATTGDATISEAAPAEEVAAEGEPSTLVMAIAEDTVSYDPARAYETLPSIVHQATYQTLVTFPPDSTETVIPGLAESWTISDDGTVYTFTLKDGVTFSDGSPVVASDFVFSYDRLKALAGNPSFLTAGIASVEAPDDSTVVITLDAPDPAILAKLVYGAFSVTSQALIEAQGGSIDPAADTAEQWLNQNSAGTGPFIIQSWDPGVQTVLVRNENYWGEPAALDRVIILNIPEAATQKIQLEAGDIDVAFDLGADQVAELEGMEGVTVYQGPSDTLIFIKGNFDEAVGGPASDPLVMKAIRAALDYEGLLALAGGSAVVPSTVLPVGFLGAYEANLPVRDLEAATALLAEAGYADGLELELTYPDFTYAGFNFGTFAQKIQADLAEAGITLSLNPQEVQVALEAYRQGTEPFGMWLWNPDYRDSNDYLEFLPEGVVGLRTGWTDANSDDVVKAIRDEGKVETETEARIAIFDRFQQYLLESGPYAPVLQPGLQVGLNSAVEGFVYNPQWRIDVSLLSK
jgi:peptide/nickel transport system substrate-binding protein